MKKLLLLLVIGVLACKEEYNPAPVVSSVDFALKEFKVDGVSDDQIRFSNDRIFITLPSDYPHGGLIKPRVVLQKDFRLTNDISQGIEFEAKEILLQLESPTNQNFTFRVFVTPTAPLKPLAGGEKEITISREMEIMVPVEKMGTSAVAGDSGKLAEAPRLLLKNTGTGITTSSTYAQVIRDSLGQGRFVFKLPVSLTEGNYEGMIKWGSRQAALQDPVKVKYGQLGLDYHSWVVGAENRSLHIDGLNIYPENRYEIEISNDFIETRRLALTRENYNRLSLKLPAEIPAGNYNARVLVNGLPYDKPAASFNWFTNLTVQSAAGRPVLVYLSQPSRYVPMGDCLFYEPATTLSRSEDIYSMVTWSPAEHPNAQLRLKFVNRKSKKEYLLKTNRERFTTMCYMTAFDAFTIPAEMPSGTYEVYAVLGYELPLLSSERHAQVITIK